ELANTYLTDPTAVSGTLATPVLRVAASDGDIALYDRYKARMKQVTSNPEEYYRYFNALGSFQDLGLMQRTLDFALSDEVRSQDTAQMIGGVMGSAAGRDLGWSYIKSHWERISRKLGNFQSLPNVVQGLGSYCSTTSAADIRQFFKQHPIPASERTLAQTLERIDNCAALEARQSPIISAWLRR